MGNFYKGLIGTGLICGAVASWYGYQSHNEVSTPDYVPKDNIESILENEENVKDPERPLKQVFQPKQISDIPSSGLPKEKIYDPSNNLSDFIVASGISVDEWYRLPLSQADDYVNKFCTTKDGSFKFREESYIIFQNILALHEDEVMRNPLLPRREYNSLIHISMFLLNGHKNEFLHSYFEKILTEVSNIPNFMGNPQEDIEEFVHYHADVLYNYLRTYLNTSPSQPDSLARIKPQIKQITESIHRYHQNFPERIDETKWYFQEFYAMAEIEPPW